MSLKSTPLVPLVGHHLWGKRLRASPTPHQFSVKTLLTLLGSTRTPLNLGSGLVCRAV